MKTKLHYVFTLALALIGFSLFGQENFFTKETNTASLSTEKSELNRLPRKFDTYSIDQNGLRNALQTAPVRGENFSSNLVLQFPNLNGEMESYIIYEASVMHPDLQAQYPEIRSYAGYGIGTSSFMRFSISPYKGVNGIILGGEQAIMFEGDSENTSIMRVFDKADTRVDNKFECSTIDILNETDLTITGNTDRFQSADATLHTFDLAMSVTGEYSAYHGGTLPLVNAAIATTITNVNAVFENDFNVTLVLIAGNDTVVYLNGATDPYDSTSDANYNQDLADTLDANFLDSDYDIGHLMAGIGNNGNAGCIGCVCVNGEYATFNHKGSAYTTSTVPIGPAFDIDYVAHEMGHQFGGNHTFTHNSEGVGIAQMEPGSGSTIMGYAGITGPTDVQSNSDPYFHAISIQQITAHVSTRTCDVETATGNNVPVANAGSNLILPIGTAFKLVGSATDADPGDTLTYCWEQFDEDNGSGSGFPDETSTNSDLPLFRSFIPTTSNTRYFPEFQTLLSTGVNSTIWEKIPTVSRSADFRLTVRDNRPGGASNDFDDMMVTWDNAYGPFEVTSQNTTGISWSSGTSETITWNVNNTNLLAGSSNVNILLSTDGGLTFPTTLASNTPNDGSESITVPNSPAPFCRILIEPVGNNFFAVNSEDFAIDFTVTTTCNQYASSPGLAITDNGDDFTETDGINVTESTTITDINIGVNITHTYIGDLLLAVLSPGGTQVNLMNPNDCGSQDNVIVEFDDEGALFDCNNSGTNQVFQSLQDELSDFNGENSSGIWTIGVGDFFASDTGTLNSWYVEVCTTEILSNPEVAGISNFSIYPNPNDGRFEIRFNNSGNEDVLIEVYDTLGRLIQSNKYVSSGNFVQSINLGNVQSGVYLVNVSNGISKSTKRIVIN